MDPSQLKWTVCNFNKLVRLVPDCMKYKPNVRQVTKVVLPMHLNRIACRASTKINKTLSKCIGSNESSSLISANIIHLNQTASRVSSRVYKTRSKLTRSNESGAVNSMVSMHLNHTATTVSHECYEARSKWTGKNKTSALKSVFLCISIKQLTESAPEVINAKQTDRK